MWPARIRTSRISSVAYATDESGSDANTASATALPRRSWRAWASGIGAPTRNRLRSTSCIPERLYLIFAEPLRFTPAWEEAGEGGSEAYVSQCSSAVASDRKIVTPRTSWNAVSKGPAVSAGSKPSLLESIGIVVPAAPERFTDTNIETATTSPNAGDCHRIPIRPTVRRHTLPRILDAWN